VHITFLQTPGSRQAQVVELVQRIHSHGPRHDRSSHEKTDESERADGKAGIEKVDDATVANIVRIPQ
jgi:hypothetical protein